MIKTRPMLTLAAAISPLITTALPLSANTGNTQDHMYKTQDNAIEVVKVWGQQLNSRATGYTSPISTITQEDLTSINVATTEDIVKFEPSLVIRRRFIGDSNGTLGIRGSNMFQTSRSMVFADGVPLHYLLQSRWSGAPRWTMVSASEIAQVDVIYGPFSAEYSGNSMGGVVLIETAIPQQREFHLDGSYFVQDFDAYGFDDQVDGFKGFVSFGDKLGDWSYYLSYNHLDNEAQPQTFRDASGSSSTGGTAVTGGLLRNDSVGRERFYIGDTGVVNTTTDNYKFKTAYEFGDWTALANIAYEDRESKNVGDSYLRDASDNILWSGIIEQNGSSYSANSSRLNSSELERDSLSIGLRLKGELTENLNLEANINQFSVLNDETRSSSANPADPVFDGTGQVTDFDDTGWNTAEIKLHIEQLGHDNFSLTSGLRWEQYELNIRVYDSADYRRGQKTQQLSGSGGESEIFAGFVQVNWDISDNWDTSFGLRAESWESSGGYYSELNGGVLITEEVPNNSENKLSPKFSLAYKPGDQWLLRYSLAQAYRFPIVEELFSQYQAYNSVSIANPELKPEDGLHQNLMLERTLDQGYMRVNLYWETVENVIESQTDPSSMVRTFVPVDEVETRGIEFIINASDFLIQNLDTRFNIAYTDSEIVKNRPDPSLEGNRFTRMPEWRANLLATYHFTPAWNVAVNWQYASDSFSRLDNTDRENNVYGAQDSYSRLGMKTTYQLDEHHRLSVGVDNITNDIDYVAHPWPGRTVYLSFGIDY